MDWRPLVLALALVAPLACVSGSEESGLPPFLLTFSASAPGGADNASLGVAAGASAGYDRGLDVPKPPPPPGEPYVAASVTSNGTPERLARDLVDGANATATWSVRADADGPEGALRLAWDRAAIDALPLRYGFDGTWNGSTFDLRDAPFPEIHKAHGASSLALVVTVTRLTGTTPDAPQDVRALPGLAPGEVNVSWSAPASDGGQPLKAYVVTRDGVEIARVQSHQFTDQGRELGRSYHYAVRAINRLGPGEASPDAVASGTAPPAPPANETRVLTVDAPLPRVDLALPPLDAPLVQAHGQGEVQDPHLYDLDVAIAGQPARHLVLYTGTPLVPGFDVDLLHAPGVEASSPRGGAGGSVGLAEGRVVLRAHLAAGPFSEGVATALP